METGQRRHLVASTTYWARSASWVSLRALGRWMPTSSSQTWLPFPRS